MDRRDMRRRKPSFAGDTLYGAGNAVVRDSSGKLIWGDSVAIPISQISKLEARRRSAIKTVLLIPVILIGALSFAFANNDFFSK